MKSHPVAKDYLSIHEVTEVGEYDEIFYLAPADKKYKPTKLERLVNNGFDDTFITLLLASTVVAFIFILL